LSPLVLVLKVYLRSCGLNEVANGGISSFALTNMVLAHIMDELRVSLAVDTGVNLGMNLRSSVIISIFSTPGGGRGGGWCVLTCQAGLGCQVVPF
jgi:hypothetical protein